MPRHHFDFEEDIDRPSRRGRADRAAYRKPSHAAAEQLFAPRLGAPAHSEAEPTKATITWFRHDKGFGFGTLVDGRGDVFIPGRAVGDEDLPPGTTISFFYGEERRVKERAVGTIIEIDRSTAIGVRRIEVLVVERTECWMLHAKDWRGSFGFVTIDNGGQRVFISGTTIGNAGLVVDQLLDQRVEIDVAHRPRGLAAAAIRLTR